MRCNKFGHQNSLSVVQLVEQRLRPLQVARVEAFSEPSVDRSEQFASLLRLPLIAPEPRHARGSAKFPGFSLLLTCNRERTLEISFSFCGVRLGRLEHDLAGRAMDFGLPPAFLRCFNLSHRFADAAPSVVELTEFGVGYPAEPLVSYQINRQLSGWNLPPLVIRAFGAHCQEATSHVWP